MNLSPPLLLVPSATSLVCIDAEYFLIVQGRDLLSIYTKLIQVLYPPKGGASREVLRLVMSELCPLFLVFDGVY